MIIDRSTMAPYIPRCGRETKAGHPCTKAHAAHAPACASHLTEQEEAERRRAVRTDWERQTGAQDEARYIEAFDMSPVCASWEPPTAPIRRLGEWHPALCAICGEVERNPRGLAEDHCHRSGMVRGYLCRVCNQQEGREGPLARLFQEYRENPPAVIAGWSYPYVGMFADLPWAQAEPWVITALGPPPERPGSDAAAYLQAAAKLTPPPPPDLTNAATALLDEAASGLR